LAPASRKRRVNISRTTRSKSGENQVNQERNQRGHFLLAPASRKKEGKVAKIKEKTGESRTKSEKGEVSQDGSGGDPQEISQEKTQGDVLREWRCLTCLATAPPVAAGYMALIKHQCTGSKQIRLIALETGEELASNFKEAQNAGLLGKLKAEAAPGDKKGLSAGGLQLTPDLNIRITITLPAIDLALFNIARRTSESG
jgi:hypothetical protein